MRKHDDVVYILGIQKLCLGSTVVATRGTAASAGGVELSTTLLTNCSALIRGRGWGGAGGGFSFDSPVSLPHSHARTTAARCKSKEYDQWLLSPQAFQRWASVCQLHTVHRTPASASPGGGVVCVFLLAFFTLLPRAIQQNARRLSVAQRPAVDGLLRLGRWLQDSVAGVPALGRCWPACGHPGSVRRASLCPLQCPAGQPAKLGSTPSISRTCPTVLDLCVHDKICSSVSYRAPKQLLDVNWTSTWPRRAEDLRFAVSGGRTRY